MFINILYIGSTRPAAPVGSVGTCPHVLFAVPRAKQAILAWNASRKPQAASHPHSASLGPQVHSGRGLFMSLISIHPPGRVRFCSPPLCSFDV